MVKLHWSLKFFSEYSFFNYCHVGKFYTVKQIQVKIYHMIGGNNQMNKTSITTVTLLLHIINPFALGDFAKKRVLKLVEWFSGHCRAIKG